MDTKRDQTTDGPWAASATSRAVPWHWSGHRVGSDAELAQLVRAQLPPAGQLVGASFVQALDGQQMAVRSPVLPDAITEVPQSGPADVERAATIAQQVFHSGAWSRCNAAERRSGLLKLADVLEGRRERLALLESIETGKPYREAIGLDITGSIARLRWYAELCDKTYGETAPPVADRIGLVSREPVGVVAAIVPWNFPLLMAITKIAPALAAGNSVILKPSEYSQLTALALGEAAIEAGLPAGVLQVLTGTGARCGQALADSHLIDALAFTGSTATGARILAAAAASNLKRVSLECGGKSPHLVLEPVRAVREVAQQIAWGICYNQGQVCDAGANLLLVGDGHEALLDELGQCMESLSIGHPLDPHADLASMIHLSHRARVQGFVDRAEAAGARIRLGGRSQPTAGTGACYQPTLVQDVDPASELFREEVFGPVLAVCRVPDAAQAVRIVNSSRFGLAAAVWAQDTGLAAQVGARLRVGVVAVNSFELGNITTPFGGFRQSGLGRDRSAHAFDNYTELKTTWMRVPALPF